jgi:protein involved in temperature-dependent protein secretion
MKTIHTMRKMLLALAAAAALLAAALGCSGAQQKAMLQADITAQIQARVPAMAECYKAALARDKTLQGEMVLTFFVPLDSVDAGEMKLESTQITDDGLKQCVAGKAQGMKLSQPAFRPTRVTYPLSFTPL